MMNVVYAFDSNRCVLLSLPPGHNTMQAQSAMPSICITFTDTEP
jgi:hypothetical protein